MARQARAAVEDASMTSPHTAATNLADCSATELLGLYRRRQASPVEATRAAVPRLQQVWISGSGHWVQQERPDAVNAALLAFLGSLPRW